MLFIPIHSIFIQLFRRKGIFPKNQAILFTKEPFFGNEKEEFNENFISP